MDTTSINTKKKIALALQGGGSHGAFTWGVLDAFMEEKDIMIEAVTGTSAGAINAACLAQGATMSVEEARKLLAYCWRRIGDIGIFAQTSAFGNISSNYNLNDSSGWMGASIMQSLFSPYQWNPLNIDPFKEMLLDTLDFDSINRSSLKLFVAATDIMAGKIKIFDNVQNNIEIEHLMASTCLPLLYQAVPIDDKFYWDGGFVANPSISPLIDQAETSDIIIVQLRKMKRDVVPNTRFEVLDRLSEITYNSCLMHDIRSIKFINDLIDSGKITAGALKRTHIHIITSEDLFTEMNINMSSAFNADPGFLQTLYQGGKKAANQWLQKYGSMLGTKGTVDEDYYSRFI